MKRKIVLEKFLLAFDALTNAGEWLGFHLGDTPYADDEHHALTLHKEVIAACCEVPSGIPGEMRDGGVGMWILMLRRPSRRSCSAWAVKSILGRM